MQIATGETKDFSMDFSAELAANGADTLSSADWTVGAGLTKVSQSSTSTVASVFVGSGVLSTSPVRLSCSVVTTGGRTLARVMYVSVVPEIAV